MIVKGKQVRDFQEFHGTEINFPVFDSDTDYTEGNCVTRTYVYTFKPPVDALDKAFTHIPNVLQSRPEYTIVHYWRAETQKALRQRIQKYAHNLRFAHTEYVPDFNKNCRPHQYHQLNRIDTSGDTYKVIGIAASIGYTVVERRENQATYKTTDNQGGNNITIYTAELGTNYKPAAGSIPYTLAEHHVDYTHVQVHHHSNLSHHGHNELIRYEGQDDAEFTAGAAQELLQHSTDGHLNNQLRAFVQAHKKRQRALRRKSTTSRTTTSRPHEIINCSTTFTYDTDKLSHDQIEDINDEAAKHLALDESLDPEFEAEYRAIEEREHEIPGVYLTVVKKNENDRKPFHQDSSGFIPLSRPAHPDKSGRGPSEHHPRGRYFAAQEVTRGQEPESAPISQGGNGQGARTKRKLDFKEKREPHNKNVHPPNVHDTAGKTHGGKAPRPLVPARGGLPTVEDSKRRKTEKKEA